MNRLFFIMILLLALFSIGCERVESDGSFSDKKTDAQPTTGLWRAVLTSPGGELPFFIRINPPGTDPPAVIINGHEEVPFSAVNFDGSRIELAIDWYDSRIIAEIAANGRSMTGEWTKVVPEGMTRMPFKATRDIRNRFNPTTDATSNNNSTQTVSVDGAWNVIFTDADGTYPARGEFVHDPSSNHASGTFLTQTGDYRYLAGDYHNGILRLSCFDGGHAFLFKANMQSDGTLKGKFWSRNVYEASWTGQHTLERADAVLEAAWHAIELSNDEGRFRFTFDNLEGNPVSLQDDQFKNKVVLVNIFGSWCPNCHDEAPWMVKWHRRYRKRGFEIVGLAYEFTGNVERDRKQVRRFADRYEIEYPLLLAGVSNKKKASKSLPDLTEVAAYPTTIFIGRNGKVRWIHSGFSGPGTGRHHRDVAILMEDRIEQLLDELPDEPSND